MNMILELFEVLSSAIKTKTDYPGPSVVSQAEGVGGHTDDIEVYGLPGVVSIPAEGARLIFVPVGGSRKNGVAVAGHNYAVDTGAAQGDTVIFAVSTDGAGIVCRVHLKNDGSIEILSDAAVTVTSQAGVTVDASADLAVSGANVDVTTDGDATINATGNAVINGTEIHLNGDSKSLVTYADLNTALQTLVSGINAALATKLAGASSPGTLTIDISAAEASTIKTG